MTPAYEYCSVPNRLSFQNIDGQVKQVIVLIVCARQRRSSTLSPLFSIAVTINVRASIIPSPDRPDPRFTSIRAHPDQKIRLMLM